MAITYFVKCFFISISFIKVFVICVSFTMLGKPFIVLIITGLRFFFYLIISLKTKEMDNLLIFCVLLY